MEGRTAIITGSTRGLGEAMARELFARGASVAITGRNQARADEIASELDPTGERAWGFGLDVTSRTSIAALVSHAQERWKRIDILVNNAGVTPARPFFEIEDDEWDAVLATNLRSVMIACQLVGPLMREQGFGRIVNHASIAGQQGGVAAGAHYAAAKAGIIVLTKIVARELAGSGVTVNAIAPAAIDGPIMQEMDAAVIARLPSTIPVGRVGRPEEVAALVAFICSDDAGYITGATLDINGGLFMR
jgi:3-oxoacyl-[acyl-carrier protein] reductase